jgi:hypothetical protein
MPPLGFEPTIAAGERSKTYALDRAATGSGEMYIIVENITFRWEIPFVPICWSTQTIEAPLFSEKLIYISTRRRVTKTIRIVTVGGTENNTVHWIVLIFVMNRLLFKFSPQS